MIKQALFVATIMFCLAGIAPASAQKKSKGTSPSTTSTEAKFMNIEFGFEPVAATPASTTTVAVVSEKTEKPSLSNSVFNTTTNIIENASALQIKYALLLNAEVENITNTNLFLLLDEWLGTRYRLGGESKDGIDCSAFSKMLYAAIFGLALPRTAKEQHDASRLVKDEELKEGDLVFFNTRGGVSHVGVYLQNGKFVHASSSNGVTISSLDDGYWASRYLGGRRPESMGLVQPRP